jgi:hypothetical protein
VIAAETLPPPADLPHQCSCCGAVYSPAEWEALTTRRSWVLAVDDVVELADCVGTYRDGDPCLNTLAKAVVR